MLEDFRAGINAPSPNYSCSTVEGSILFEYNTVLIKKIMCNTVLYGSLRKTIYILPWTVQAFIALI